MSRVCILTDATAQFPTPNFPGCDLVSVIPLHIRLNNRLYQRGKGVRVTEMPASARNGLNPCLQSATPGEFTRTFQYLGKRYDEIVVILLSSGLNPAIENAKLAATFVRGRIGIFVVDSQTTAVGLGLLVQSAAELAALGYNGLEIKRQVLGLVPHVYSMFYIPGLSYLSHTGMVSPAQALVGELLGVMPLFIMDNGQLVPVQKARSSRHLVDSLHEFVCEFGDLRHIAMIQGIPPYEQELRALRERILEDYPANTISDHTIGPSLATMLGPRNLSLFIMEAA